MKNTFNIISYPKNANKLTHYFTSTRLPIIFLKKENQSDGWQKCGKVKTVYTANEDIKW